jgi:hypothetical protein
MSDELTVYDVRLAINKATSQLQEADRAADAMADCLLDRLRQVSPLRLAKMKRTLQQFNAATLQWKD